MPRDIHALTLAFRRSVVQAESRQARSLIAAYADISNRLEASATSLGAQIEAAVKAGEAPTPNLLFRQARYESMLARVKAEIDKVARGQLPKFGRTIDFAAGQGVKMAAAQIGGMTSFDGFSRAAFERIVGATREATPLAALLDSLGAAAAESTKTALIAGVGQGLNPKVTAQIIKNQAGLSLQRSLVISRTETLRAYRSATLDSYRASGQVTGWQWLSAQDDDTCDACWSMDGSVFDLSETLDDHPNGRCTRVPVMGSESPDVPSAQSAFDALSASQRAKILGPAKAAAYESGALSLKELAGVSHSPAWGSSIRSRPLSSLGIN